MNDSTTDGEYLKELKNLKDKYFKENKYKSGWVCPKCGRVNAPFVSECSCTKEMRHEYIPYPVYPYHPYKFYWDGPYYEHCIITC